MINRLVDRLKWPAAALSALLLPGLVLEAIKVVYFISRHLAYYQPLLLGAALYGGTWMLLRGRNFGSSWFVTLEHELTHALFAVLTFNRVTNLNASWSNGGQVEYRGAGNWLVTISPYFVPTLALGTIWVTQITRPYFYRYMMLVTGFLLLYHIHTTWRQIHPEQSDLQKVGSLFCWMFLPGANLLLLLYIITALPGDYLHADTVINNSFATVPHWLAAMFR